MSAKKTKKVKTTPSSVCRVNKNANYTVMSNYHLRSTNLSLKAIGLLSKVLSLPENWDYSISGLTAICKEKETAIKAALDELKHWGYLNVTKLMPNETNSGRIEYVYDFYEYSEKDTPDADRDDDDTYAKVSSVKKAPQGAEKQGIENLPLEILLIEKQAVENQGQAAIARNFIDLFTRAAGITPALNVGSKEGQVRFVTDSSFKPEAYLLEITPQQILIKASDTKGFFYALQSIRQLLPAAIESEQPVQNIAWNVPAMIVRDEPRFGFRGLLLDPVRYFIPKENVLRIIDCMAMLKINKLHFHLTE